MCKAQDGVVQSAHSKMMQYGTNALTDEELLLIALQINIQTVDALFQTFNSLRGLETASEKELTEIKGIGEKKATAIRAIMALGRRVATKPLDRGQSYISSQQVFEAFRARFSGLEYETLWAILLNNQNQILKEVQVAVGTTNRCVVEPQSVFTPAIRERAIRVILLHNHPSGDSKPSMEDRRMTTRLVEAGKLLNIEIIDHLVIGDGSYTAFSDKGWLP